jgi:tRNA modification GTPase
LGVAVLDAVDTICAPATARGKAAIAVIRLSGPNARAAVTRLSGRETPGDRRLRLRRLHDPVDNRLLDEALVVGFAQGASPTGEEAAEIQVHGGLAVVNAVMAALLATPGVRLAKPGEFSRRALDGGRLDLTALEGLADLIDAETEAQRRLAARLMGGALRDAIAAWRSGLVEARALIEASLDFADEDEIPDAAVEAGKARLRPVLASLAAALASADGAALTREGFEIAVIGPPNAGKSSIINRIAGREIALTSPVAGTTRDVIEVRCDIGGMLVTIVDTAGQRETTDQLEALGVERARRRAETADLRIVVQAPDAIGAPPHREGDILLWNKCDVGVGDGLPVSALTGEGFDALLARVEAALQLRTPQDGLLSRSRHVDMVRRTADHVAAALAASPEIAAEELRLACDALDLLIGRVDPDHVLDEIFSRFCLGK